MRKKIRPNIRFGYIALSISIIFLLFLNIFSFSTLSADEDNQLHIYITDINEKSIEEILEAAHFIVSVYTITDEGGSPDWMTEVDIEFNDMPYKIGEDGYKTFEAPLVDEDTQFSIKASKEGFVTIETFFTVMDSIEKIMELKIEVATVVDANKKFTVLITDKETGDPINGVSVGIQSDDDDTVITGKGDNPDGIAVLIAPDDYDSIILIATKEGYIKDTVKVYINIEDPWWQDIIDNEYFLIAVAAICLVCAILFVNLRSRKSIFKRAKEITDEKVIKKYSSKDKKSKFKSDDQKEKKNEELYSRPIVRSQFEKDPRVEEIRISRPAKEKEIVKVETEEDKADKILSEKRNKKKDYDWFEGTDDVRYEIDKLTGKVDEEGLDKWFEGISDLKDKIDEKVKKKDKKKNDEKEE